MITIGEDHEAARLEDLDTGEIHEFTGSRALYDALGVLADWRDRDKAAASPFLCSVVNGPCPGDEHGMICLAPCRLGRDR